jgi:hypothetical protein
MTVTRIQIADLVCDAFSPSGASKDELLTTAEANDAPDQVLSQLRTLPTRHFAADARPVGAPSGCAR